MLTPPPPDVGTTALQLDIPGDGATHVHVAPIVVRSRRYVHVATVIPRLNVHVATVGSTAPPSGPVCIVGKAGGKRVVAGRCVGEGGCPRESLCGVDAREHLLGMGNCP